MPNEIERLEWNGFDAQFIDECIRNSVRGWIFDSEAAKRFVKPENDALLGKSFQVYFEAAQRLGKEHPDHDYLAKTQEILLTLRYMGRGMSIVHHPQRSINPDDYAACWDGSNEGWAVTEVPAKRKVPQSILIFHPERREVLMIDNAATHAEVVRRVRSAGRREGFAHN